MRKVWLAVLGLVMIAGCGPRKVIESKYANGNPNVVKYYEKKNGKEQLVKEEVFYENKMKKMEGAYENNERNGHWQVWYEDGKVWSEGDYRNGKRNGLGIVYYPNGKKYIESYYTDDLKTGTWHFYDSSGKVIKTVNFDMKGMPMLDTTLIKKK